MYEDENTPADYGAVEPDPVLPGPEQQLTPPIDWWKLPSGERVAQLNRLWVFTRRLVRSYRLPTEVVPPCWFAHEELVQELLALMQYRNEQQFIEQQTPGAGLDFHVQLQLWLGRMRAWVAEAGCKGNEHLEKTAPMWAVAGSVAASSAEQNFDEYLVRLKENEE